MIFDNHWGFETVDPYIINRLKTSGFKRLDIPSVKQLRNYAQILYSSRKSQFNEPYVKIDKNISFIYDTSRFGYNGFEIYEFDKSGNLTQKTRKLNSEQIFTYLGINNTSGKRNERKITKEQFVEFMYKKLLNAKNFKLTDLKDPEIRNLAKLFEIPEGHIRNMEKNEYYKLRKNFNSDKTDSLEYKIFCIINKLYSDKFKNNGITRTDFVKYMIEKTKNMKEFNPHSLRAPEVRNLAKLLRVDSVTQILNMNKNSWRNLCLKFHPDVNKKDPLANDIFIIVSKMKV